MRKFAFILRTYNGFVATVDQLARINEVGFRIESRCVDLLHPLATGLSESSGLPAFPFLASYHGEFELVFTVPATRVSMLEVRAVDLGWKPIRVGVVESEPGVRFGGNAIDCAALRNALELSGGDVRAYADALLRFNVP